jgi:hypothetical protein
VGERLRTRFASGEAVSRIEQTEPATEVPPANRPAPSIQNSDEEKSP